MIATDLVHAFGGVDVLQGVSFDATPGQCLAIIGPTGCGKSTVLRMLAGLITPTGGHVQIDGAPPSLRTPRGAYMPQADTLLPWRRALENATLGAEIRGEDPHAAATRARELFSRFGLDGFEHSWPHELSGGMRQRVALLRTVIADLPVLLLDEPFGALDAITRTTLQGWLADLLAATGRTSVLVTHDIDEALRLADTIVVLSSRPGRVLATITPQGVRPRSPSTITQPEFATQKREILRLLTPALQ
ncbi:MAG TPA: ABC transporter ATP-binding protein [Miltoncostaeales bacterium]|nr:ABC transporter ATP-binding protein [Miltoncostaeales bacterium]